jgi:7,8-dihydropterin-6-yl-methyl-4-(beta-D-ribofuranosyl)aminobenzene 5'-phosphate synthase
MQTTLTVLCENSVAGSGVIGEHGFSVLIERPDAVYLFDTGPGLSLPHNCRALDKNLARVEKIFLSHGHYDHTGGLEYAVSQSAPVEVVAHESVFAAHMIGDPENRATPLRYIGCPVSPGALEAAGARLRLVGATCRVAPDIHFVTGVRRRPAQSVVDTRLQLPDGDGPGPLTDPVSDDASLLIEGPHPPVLVLGCAHAGLLNILDHLQDEMGITRLAAVLGGTHLMFSGAALIAKTIQRLEDFSVRQVAACHCTGFDAAAMLAAHFKGRFSRACVGAVYHFGAAA